MIKKLLLASAATLISTGAFAADLPARTYTKAPVMPVQVYNWTGFYIGAHIGGGWADLGTTELPPGTPAFPIGTVFTKNNLSGFLGGAQVGYNWQVANNFVIGAEGEYSWADVHGTATTVSTVNGFNSTVTAKTKDFAFATARLGYAVDNWLFYGKGGGAWANGSSTGVGTLANGTFFDNTTTGSSRTGWVVGVGAEWGFAPNWSAKLEYNHVDFGSRTVAVNDITFGTTTIVNSSETVDIIKAGVNYRFNWGAPLVARY